MAVDYSEINRRIQEQIKRLYDNSDYEVLINEYVWEVLTDNVILYVLKNNNFQLELLHGLTVPEVFEQTIKILTLMEASDNKEQFEELIEKTKVQEIKQAKPERTDFDKLLGGFMKAGKMPVKNKKK